MAFSDAAVGGAGMSRGALSRMLKQSYPTMRMWEKRNMAANEMWRRIDSGCRAFARFAGGDE
jgi:hypothetical protein